MILRKRFRNFFLIFCNGLTFFVTLAKHKTAMTTKVSTYFSYFFYFFFGQKKGLVLCYVKK